MNKQFTVIALHADNGQIVSHEVTALDGLHAFAVVAEKAFGVDLVVAIEGSLTEGDQLTFAGECLVSDETIRAQADVFGASQSLSDDEYVAKGGGICPACGTDEIVGDAIDVDGPSASQAVHCCCCSAEWTDKYQLQGYANLVTG